MKSPEIDTPAPRTPASVDVPAEYRSLHKYLDGRYADTVVLRFAEIEDLLGFALPDHARLQQDWWANADADGEPSTQSRSWIHAARSARRSVKWRPRRPALFRTRTRADDVLPTNPHLDRSNVETDSDEYRHSR